MSSRRKARELALQILFQQDLNQGTAEELLELFWQVHPADPEAREFAELLFKAALENRDHIDELIRGHAQNWRLERMAAVDRNVLRLALGELLYTETPHAVVIDEAIEIARRFSTTESSQFVNGILDAIREEMEDRPVKEGQHG
jgi:N utilization substance protein B